MSPETEAALAQLRDIHLPEPVSFWPPAPGWWLLAAGLVVAALAGGWWWRRRRRTDLRRAAALELTRLEARYRGSRDRAELAAGLSSLLRRVALARHPRDEVAAAHGERWVALLSAPERGAGIPRDVGSAIERAVYAPADAGVDGADCDGWIACVRRFVRSIP